MSETAVENEVVRDLAIASVVPHVIDGPRLVVVPREASTRIIDDEHLLGRPKRQRATAKPETVEALLSYTRTHAEGGRAEVWVSRTSAVAVLNGAAGPDLPGWGDHRAELRLEHTPEWLHWAKLDGRMVSQAEFAEHVEEALIDIVEPEGADMLEIVRHFHVTRDAKFQASHHLQSGAVEFEYVESDKASAGKASQFEIPHEFTLGIPVYKGEEAYRIAARFRYRIHEGHLTLGYKLDRPDVTLNDAVEQIAKRIGTELEDVARVYAGSAPSPIAAGR